MITTAYMQFGLTYRFMLAALLAFSLAGMPLRGWSQNDWSTAPRTALVIGNGSYASDPLATPLNDAGDMAQTLRELGFEVLEKKDLGSLEEMAQAVNEFADQLRRRGGVGLFYYSGHGAQLDGQNYLLPVKAPIYGPVDVKYQALPAEQVLDNMKVARAGVNIVILDACRSNPYKGWYKGEGVAGLAGMRGPKGSFIAYATEPGEVALGGVGRNSPYTAALLQVIRTPGLPIEKVFKEVRTQVMEATKERQIPWESTSLWGSEFYFIPTKMPPEWPAPQPSRPTPAPAQVATAPTPATTAPPVAAAAEAAFQDPLKDGTAGPAMVKIRGGRFFMGSPAGEPGRDQDERQHEVQVADFAIGKYEVTFDEYDRFAEATGREKPADEGWGRGQRPVINVDWWDAMAYAEWLSRQTGKRYRLPTEAEWEYAARAGTQTAYWWGVDVGRNQANCDGCGGRWDNQQTAPVGSFPANPFGLYDTAGNVWEWTCSEYNEDYGGAEERCVTDKNLNNFRALRGGSWGGGPAGARAAARGGYDSHFGYPSTGFRLARD